MLEYGTGNAISTMSDILALSELRMFLLVKLESKADW